MTIVGKVQDVGLRAVIEYAGRLLDLSGLVFNAKDGSVRIICCGESHDITEFSNEIKIRGEQRGAIIQNIKKQEIPVVLDLPYPFSRALADEDTDIGRKPDKGNEYLGEIKGDTSALVTEMRGHNQQQMAFNQEMREHNQRMDEHNRRMDGHNQRLEKILEKLAER